MSAPDTHTALAVASRDPLALALLAGFAARDEVPMYDPQQNIFQAALGLYGMQGLLWHDVFSRLGEAAFPPSWRDAIDRALLEWGLARPQPPLLQPAKNLLHGWLTALARFDAPTWEAFWVQSCHALARSALTRHFVAAPEYGKTCLAILRAMHGAGVDLTRWHGQYAELPCSAGLLHSAVSQDNPVLVQWLLEIGFDPAEKQFIKGGIDRAPLLLDAFQVAKRQNAAAAGQVIHARQARRGMNAVLHGTALPALAPAGIHVKKRAP